MKSITTIVLLMIVVTGFAQRQPEDPATLARKIVAPYNTEREKSYRHLQLDHRKYRLLSATGKK